MKLKFFTSLALLCMAGAGALAQTTTTYTVAGSSVSVFGTEWDPTNTANDLTLQTDGTYQLVKEGVVLDGSKIDFKVVKDHEWTVNWGVGGVQNGPNFTYTPSVTGTQNITFTFNLSTGICTAEVAVAGTYAVSLADGTADADKWTAKVGSADAQALPVEAAEGDAVTVIYSGTKNVKSVKAVKVDDAIDLSKVTADLTLQNGNVVTGTLKENVKISIADGATVTLRNVNITGDDNEDYQWAGLNCLGDATIILADGTTNTVKGFYSDYPGIHVPADYTLTIQGTGVLNASSNGVGCGIGGGNDILAGNIVIEGGNITATGGDGAAGIGSGNLAVCGTITISGGTIEATGGNFAAGIGSGVCANCGAITISGGTVVATGGDDAAGIGSGKSNAECGNITITDKVTSVTAKKGENAPNSIGASNGSSCGTVTIGGVVVGAITKSSYTYTPGMMN